MREEFILIDKIIVHIVIPSADKLEELKIGPEVPYEAKKKRQLGYSEKHALKSVVMICKLVPYLAGRPQT